MFFARGTNPFVGAAPHIVPPHWQRSARSPHRPASTAPLITGAGRRGRRPLRSSIGKHSVGADAYIGPPHRTPCNPSVGATLAVARGRGRAPPLRTTRYTFFGAGVLDGPTRIFPAPPAGHTGPALQGVALSGLGGQGRPPLQPIRRGR